MCDLKKSLKNLRQIVLVALLAAVPAAGQAQFGYMVNASNANTITITNYTGLGGIVNIPATINGLTVTGIGSPGFSFNFNVTGVTMPGAITSIGGAFDACKNLTNLTIPSNVTSIADDAFYQCHSLQSIIVPGGATNIGVEVFAWCISLTNAILMDGITSIPGGMFAGCTNLVSLTFPSNITSMGEDALNGTALNSFIIPSTMTIIDDEAFEGTDLMTNVVVPPTVTSISEFAFNYSGITSISIPEGVTNIGYLAFNQCGLTNVTIPGSAQFLDDSIFSGCESLAYVTIAAGISNITYDMLSYCTNLSGVMFQGNAPNVTGFSTDGPTFAGDPKAVAYYLPGTTGWSNTYQGIPAVEWNPSVAPATMHNGQFGVTVTGNTNIPIQLQACTNLSCPVWAPLTNVSLTNGSFYYSEPVQSNSPSRFYRVVFP